jgi:hypothetical protein
VRYVNSSLLWLAQAVPINNVGTAVNDLTDRVADAAKAVLQSTLPGVPLTTRAWNLARSAMSAGGIAFTHLARAADVAFVSSHARMMTNVRSLRPELDHLFRNPHLNQTPTATAVCEIWDELCEAAPATADLINWECPDPRSALRSHIQRAVDDAAINELDNNATGIILPKQRAFEHAARGEVGGAFTSLPTCPANTWGNADWAASVAKRLGLNPRSAISSDSPSTTHHCSTCGMEKMDPRGDHAECCYADGNAERDVVHDAIKFQVAQMCAAAGHKVTVEPRGSYADSNKRPDVRLTNYHAFGSHLDIDVGTISTASEQVFETAAILPGFAADKVEKEKHARWDDVAKAEDNTIVIIAYELGGRFGGEALKFFDTIARESTSTSVAAAAFKSYWLRRISTAAQKAHGSLLRARLPRPQAPAMGGIRAPAAPLAHIIDFPNQATIAGRGPRSPAA